jgi:hypothetical protein
MSIEKNSKYLYYWIVYEGTQRSHQFHTWFWHAYFIIFSHDQTEEFRFNYGSFLICIVGGGAGVQLGPLGTAATIGLLCQPRVIMIMEKMV